MVTDEEVRSTLPDSGRDGKKHEPSPRPAVVAVAPRPTQTHTHMQVKQRGSSTKKRAAGARPKPSKGIFVYLFDRRLVEKGIFARRYLLKQP